MHLLICRKLQKWSFSEKKPKETLLTCNPILHKQNCFEWGWITMCIYIKMPADSQSLQDARSLNWTSLKKKSSHSILNTLKTQPPSYRQSWPKRVGTHRTSVHGSWLPSSSREHRTDESQPQAWHLGQGQYPFHPQQSKSPASPRVRSAIKPTLQPLSLALTTCNQTPRFFIANLCPLISEYKTNKPP